MNEDIYHQISMSNSNYGKPYDTGVIAITSQLNIVHKRMEEDYNKQLKINEDLSRRLDVIESFITGLKLNINPNLK